MFWPPLWKEPDHADGLKKLKIHHVQFTLGEQEIIVNAFSEAMGEIKRKKSSRTLGFTGDIDFRIASNTNYFLDVMKIFAAETDKITVQMSGSRLQL